MSVVDVGIVINARDNASATIGRVRNALNQLNSGGGGGGLRSLVTNFGGAGRAAFGFLSRLNTVAAAAFVVYHSIRTVVVGLAEFAAESQKASVALIVTTGNVQNAQEQFARMIETFGPAGFAIENMVQNFNALRGAGLGVADANRTLEATAAAISAFGGSQPQLDRAVMALSQIGAKGVAQMEELRGQLSEAVPIALAIMADQAGISIRELMDRVKRGLVSSEEAIRLFTQGAEELFEGLLESQRQTLVGAVAEMKKSVQVGLGELFARTDLDERLIVIIHDVTESINNFFDSIQQEQIDAFFQGMTELGEAFDSVMGILGALNPIFVALGEAIGPLLPIVLDLIQALADFVALAISGVLVVVFKLAEGYALMTGNIRLAEAAQRGLNETQEGVRRSGDRLLGGGGERSSNPMTAFDLRDQVRAAIQRENAARRLTELQRRQAEFERQSAAASREQLRIQERLRDLVMETNAQFQGSLLSFVDNLDRIANRVADIFELENFSYDVRRASLDAMRGMTAEQARQAELQRALASGVGSQLAQIRANAVGTFVRMAEEFRTNMADAMDEVRIAQLDAFADITGGSVEAAALRVTLEFRRQQRELETMLEQVRQLNERTGTEEQTIAAINALLERSNELRAMAVAHAERMQALAQQELIVRRQLEAIELEAQARTTARENGDNPLVQMGLGTDAGQTIARVEEQRRQLNQSIEELRLRMARLNAELQNATGANAEAIRRQIESINGLITAQSDAMAKLSENAVLSRELWQDVGRTIQDSVGDAIEGVITGSRTLEDVGIQMFNALTRAAIDYIVQLIIIQALKMATGFADGGVVGGGSTKVKLASGGTAMNSIVRGPTMFQAGEAGEEGIFPLARVNGKLGIRASGAGGGDTFNIHLSAIDTQTGVEFLLKNRSVIVGALRREMMLNKGVDRVRA